MKETSVSIRNARRTMRGGLAGIAALGLLAVLASASCTVITNTEKNQCAATSDCAAKGAAFAGTQCVEGVCVAGGGDAGKTTGCTSNSQCLANPDTPNTYCAADGSCVSMLTEDCTSIVTSDGKAIHSDAIVLGVMGPLTGPNAADGRACVQAMSLGFQEFVQFAIGIPSGPSGTLRPLAFVVCDQMVNPERAATHLALNVRIPAMLGPGFSTATTLVAKKVAIPNGVLVMTPTVSSPDLGLLQDNGLVWRTSSSFAPEANAMASMLAGMESMASVRTALGLDTSTPLRVAILAKGDAYGKGLADLLLTTLRFNGKDVAGNAGNFARYDFPDLTAMPDADTSVIVNPIVTTFKPHVIIGIGSSEVILKGIDPIEDQWMTGVGSQPRPFYLLSEGVLVNELIGVVATSQTLHPDRVLKNRIRGFSPRFNAALAGALSARYQATFGEPIPSTYGVAGSYDAFYLLAYALTASRAEQPTGATIASGLQRIVAPGMRITAGPTDLAKGIAELAAGRNIDYDGVVGALDYDVTTGDAPCDYSVYCVQPTGLALTSQYYSTVDAALLGDYSECP